MKSRSDYEWGKENGVLWIIDKDLCRMSVTNDIENVLFDLASNIDKSDIIVYRDSEGIWDGVLHDGCEFRGFFLAGAASKEEAYSIMKQHCANATKQP